MRSLSTMLHLSFSFLYQIFILTSNYLKSDYTLRSCNFDQIYQFGDSLSDVGNFIREPPFGPTTVFTRPPYGQTFFKSPTGRVTDGLLLIDYIALEAGLPLLNPHYNYEANFSHGEDFAVAGATVLSGEVLADHGISSWVTNSSLGVQLDWLLAHFNSTCYPNKDCAEMLKNSLFIVGEIGGNDYNYAFNQGKTLAEVEEEEVPAVIQTIINTARTLIKNGARRIVIPGQLPLGCFPIHLTLFHTNDSAAFDEFHCLKAPNNMLKYHNEKLQEAIQKLKQEFPNTIIIYGDYYSAFLWLYRNAPYFGFDSSLLQKSCCGIGGEYNYDIDPEKACGLPEVPICPDPRIYISWDGVHMTQEAHKMLAIWIINDILPELKCSPNLDLGSLGRKSLKMRYFASM